MEPELKELFMEALRLYILDKDCIRVGAYERDSYDYFDYEVVAFSEYEGYLVKVIFTISKKIGETNFNAVTTLAAEILYFILFFNSRIKEEEVEFKFSLTEEGLEFYSKENVDAIKLTVKVSLP